MATSSYPTITLKTPRLLLRALFAEDAERFKNFQRVNREHFFHWTPTAMQNLDDDAMFNELLKRTEEGYDSGSGFRLLGIAEDGRVVGVFVLSEVVRRAFQNAYAGWRVSREFLKQGFGTEGVRGLLDLAFAPAPHGLGLHRVQANIQPSNLPSIALANRVGFRGEGLAKRYLNIDGGWRDHLMFAKTSDEHDFKFIKPQVA